MDWPDALRKREMNEYSLVDLHSPRRPLAMLGWDGVLPWVAAAVPLRR